VETGHDAGGLIALAWRTPAAWVESACSDAGALLSDHAHCELRAAASAQGLIERNPGRTRMVRHLAALAEEELGHFRRVLAVLARRGSTLQPAGANPYVEALLAAARETRATRATYADHARFNGGREALLLDRLLAAGLIEARSRERFGLLAARAPDAELRRLYAELLPSEERHARLFAALAAEVAGADRARERLGELADLEAVAARAQARGPRVHSGVASQRAGKSG
jgi:tRNA-(ms[2]io[6]A)-hydroxylase